MDPVPSLRALVEEHKLDLNKLCVPFVIPVADRPVEFRREMIFVISGEDGGAIWQVESLRQLFRGEKQPPPDLDHYPPDYARLFYFMESHFISLCDSMSDRTDQEMEEVYSLIRRRPDGKSLGKVHDVMWQVAALLLGLWPLSQAEFTALVGTLERSVRTWALKPISRNYIDYLRRSFSTLE